MNRKEAQKLLAEMETQATENQAVADAVIPWIETVKELIDDIQKEKSYTKEIAGALQQIRYVTAGEEQKTLAWVYETACEALRGYKEDYPAKCPKCAHHSVRDDTGHHPKCPKNPRLMESAWPETRTWQEERRHWEQIIKENIDHLEDNGREVEQQFPNLKMEGRCRQLAAALLREMLHCRELDDVLMATKESRKNDT